ncbi:MAG: ABC transporter substrate-binding protein [Alphaproteobacteria bacterium]|nr:ABC transporter substrate-binding protein [Alphaproteobacteria bacterium]
MAGLTRRGFGGMAAGAALTGSLPFGAASAAADNKTLRFIAQSDLRVLDPLWTTAYITRNHGYMVFDTPFAIDAEFVPHPQMVGEHALSSDQLTYNFKLRDGLGFHDGSPVRGADCVASLKRWMARDGLGQSLKPVIDTMTPDGDKGFTIKLKEAFPLLLDGLAKVSSLPPFIMPERLANTDPFQQITEMVGSGPFKFVKEEFEPGHRVVYARNTDYKPRAEPPSWASGGKVVKVDRVEWLYIPDAMTKVAALTNGEADWWENPTADVLPVLTGNSDIAIMPDNPLGQMTMVRFNCLYPPFDNPKMRQAVLMVTDQRDFMRTLVGDQKYWEVCASFFTCGTPMASTVGSEALTGPRDYDKAKALIKEAGYKGEKIMVLDAVDLPNPHVQAIVIFDVLKRLGLNAELVSADWGTVVTRRASKKPPEEGGWNIFGTGWVGADLMDPTTNLALQTKGDAAWFGWPKDDRIETLRAAWIKAATPAERKKIADDIQQRAFEIVPYLPTGEWTQMTAYRKNVKGIISAPAFLMWNVEKV